MIYLYSATVITVTFNPIALRMAKTLSECNRVKVKVQEMKIVKFANKRAPYLDLHFFAL